MLYILNPPQYPKLFHYMQKVEGLPAGGHNVHHIMRQVFWALQHCPSTETWNQRTSWSANPLRTTCCCTLALLLCSKIRPPTTHSASQRAYLRQLFWRSPVLSCASCWGYCCTLLEWNRHHRGNPPLSVWNNQKLSTPDSLLLCCQSTWQASRWEYSGPAMDAVSQTIPHHQLLLFGYKLLLTGKGQLRTKLLKPVWWI